jgi:hypothetical protein
VPSQALAYFLNSNRDVVRLETVEISHPAFTQTYRRVRNARDGVTVTLEDGVTEADFSYYPMTLTELGDQANLDTGIRVDFGDLGEVLPRELDAVYAADEMGTKPAVIYRAYRSDDLTSPLIGPLKLQATTFSFKREGASFEASAPYINNTKTGETYNLTRFPMQRGFLK